MADLKSGTAWATAGQLQRLDVQASKLANTAAAVTGLLAYLVRASAHRGSSHTATCVLATNAGGRYALQNLKEDVYVERCLARASDGGPAKHGGAKPQGGRRQQQRDAQRARAIGAGRSVAAQVALTPAEAMQALQEIFESYTNRHSYARTGRKEMSVQVRGASAGLPGSAGWQAVGTGGPLVNLVELTI